MCIRDSVKGDLSKEPDVNKILKFAKSKLKYFDCLINNASLFENDKLENFTADSWGRHLRTNLRAPALLSKEFSKNIKGKNNNIINIIDQRVFKLTPFFFSYTISKTGLYTMTERNKEPFLDWFAIWPGATGYDADGAAFISEAPAGVELAVQQPTITEPVVVSDKPWEGKTLGTSTVLVEDGTYRLWYSADCGMCYAESPDGFNWEKPELNILEIDGSTANNVVYGRGVAGNIFRDPSAPDAERYKLVDLDASWVHEGKDILEEEALRLREELMKMTATQEELAAKLSIRGQVTGAVSPDGLRWEVIKEPLFVKFCDTQNVVLYDPERKKIHRLLAG